MPAFTAHPISTILPCRPFAPTKYDAAVSVGAHLLLAFARHITVLFLFVCCLLEIGCWGCEIEEKVKYVEVGHYQQLVGIEVAAHYVICTVEEKVHTSSICLMKTHCIVPFTLVSPPAPPSTVCPVFTLHCVSYIAFPLCVLMRDKKITLENLRKQDELKQLPLLQSRCTRLRCFLSLLNWSQCTKCVMESVFQPTVPMMLQSFSLSDWGAVQSIVAYAIILSHRTILWIF